MITASEVAKIWNERAKKENRETNYTRFSVYTQRDNLGGIDTPLGRLFNKERAETIPLPKYHPRPDTAQRNRASLTGRKRDKETNQFLPALETDTQNT